MFFNIFGEPKPYNEGFLPESDGHKVYFAEYGNPKGKPVLVFHGGPGDSSSSGNTKYFDLKRYRVILFDQRGCGKSIPLGEMKDNTTEKSIEDATRLVSLLEIKDKIIVRGASWGSTLALLFAIKNHEKISKIIISAVFLANKENQVWSYETSRLFYPDVYDKLIEVDSAKKIKKYYANLINSNDIDAQEKAFLSISRYESSLGLMSPSNMESREITKKDIMSTKIFINYLAKDFFMKDNEILNNIENIQNINTLIIHNRIDMICPLENAYLVHKSMPNSKLVINPLFGHWGKELSEIVKIEIKNFLKEDK